MTAGQVVSIHGPEFSEDHVRQALALDALYYSSEYLAQLETCLVWRRRNPEIYSGLVDCQSGGLVGYLNLMPIEDHDVSVFLASSFNDIETQPEKILSTVEGRTASGYFASACLRKEYRGIRDNGQYLLDNLFFEKLAFLKGKKFDYGVIWARQVSESGRRFLERLGFEKQSQSVDILRLDVGMVQE